MEELGDSSVKLAISFPPFMHDPRAQRLDKAALLSMLRKVHQELFRVLSPDGVLVSVNTDVRDRPIYNKPRDTTGAVWWKHHAIREICEEIGFRCLGTKIWVKTLKQNLYRFTYSYIVFYGKERRALASRRKKRSPDFKPDVWLLEGQTNFRLPDGRLFRDCLHPLLVERCIRELSEAGDLILAPFAGVGTIPIVAQHLNRRWSGYEIDTTLRPALVKRLGRHVIQ